MKIKKISIQNFKGIKSLDADFGDIVKISGRNGSGKSSVMDAYFWCLFNKNGFGNQFSAYPLDKNNEPIHKVMTSVELTVEHNGNDVTIKRTQVEDWSKPTGKTVEKLKGYKQERFINGTPLGVVEFGNRLNEMCNVEDWFMLSSITAFMSMKMEERRRRLMKLVLAVSDEDLAVDYPMLLAELKKGKTVDDVLVTYRMSKKKANDDLLLMPARMDQNEKLKVDYDFTALEAEANTIDTEIQSLKHDIETFATEHNFEMVDNLRKQLSKMAGDMNRIEDDVRNKVNKSLLEAKNNKQDAEMKAEQSKRKIARLEESIKQNYDELQGDNGLKHQIDELRNQWRTRNQQDTESEVARWAEEHADDVSGVCPTCGQPLPIEKVENERQMAVNAYRTELNNAKVQDLRNIEGKAKRIKLRIDELNQQDVQSAEDLKAERANCEKLLESAKEFDAKIGMCETYEEAISRNEEYANVNAEREKLKQQVEELGNDNGSKEELERLKLQLKDKESTLKVVRDKLAQKQANERCDKQRIELEKENLALLQAVADCDKMLDEIMQFKKAKVTMVESRVNRLFKLVRFKMYEPNLTNDGEKEICQPIVDGVPYELLNTASKVNAGIDIINGLSNEIGIDVPVFVDNKESVTKLVETRQQLVTLEVSNSDLTISNE